MSTKYLTTEQAMRYNRQIVLPNFDLDKQEILLNAKILIVGVGGLGCAAAQYLVAAGVGEITLIDDDKVEKTNLQRQILHAEADVGINKCLSAKASLEQMNSDIKIHVIQKRLELDNYLELIESLDLVLDCTDNLTSRNTLNQACYQLGKPLVSGAAIRMEGQLMNIVPAEKSACYACVSAYFGEQNLSCVESGVMSPVVGIIGAMQALEAIKVLCDYGVASVNQIMMFDGMTATWQTFKVPKKINCSICA
ncbi:molybdopterin-synthase adenylyltransferase MoeB [uncultured Paraglaciecola sp.]|uniref:molybdopterin-synthase adenylyltransferase MoeB n=1 Tax=uncultured Paraglaciecola sp. TaxID=1765024 RepID=UPI0025ED0573|nr:molybdopterin-synthase adenylyltransferase MoeB [uncultured Paraglaciecola sp.]